MAERRSHGAQLSFAELLWLTLATLPCGVPPLLLSVIGLGPALALALTGSGLIGLLFARRRRSLKPVMLGGLLTLLVAGLLVLFGSTRSLFLPGLIFGSVWSPLLLASGFTRWPIIGYLLARVDSRLSGWQTQPQMLRVLRGLTIAWGLVACARVSIQWWLYAADHASWLVASHYAERPIHWVLIAVSLRLIIRLHREAPAGVRSAGVLGDARVVRA